ncbi:ATP-dependent helicase [Sinomonas sp. ASV322]|uniref:ATP-dependent helicase n=1 Tax=Sinomonas sp. ASV322 TaxID=3041920 RepID=UPI0027DE4E65|nr:ATP-dependent helicase [Sinomonas sp. ASV322]MDQ4503033.1 ATP-dependent helicase [Sinomonas sp. ASV322]
MTPRNAPAAPEAGAVLGRFGVATREWFLGAFREPTPAQAGAWEAISSGRHALVVAPTGSGKTLAAFLWSLDRLMRHDGAAAASAPASGTDDDGGALPGLSLTDVAAQEAVGGGARTARGGSRRRTPKNLTKILYISPLKALGVDVERNLRAPLIGISQTARRLGLPVPEVSVGVRSGDTTASDRRALLSNPPDILITTPESLYLMLTSQARETLMGVETVIVDEVHAVAGTKRGAHLAVSLERLDALLPKPAQRIGLSATVEPRELVAQFLAGQAPCEIVAPPATKTWELTVTVPVEDMSDLQGAAAAHDMGPASGLQPQASIWPHVEEKIVDLILANRSTIVFSNSRRLAERLTGRLNEIYAERMQPNVWDEPVAPEPSGVQGSPPVGRDPREVTPERASRAPTRTPAEMMAQAGQTAGADPVLARAHHGSVSKEQRAQIEDDLKSGRLRCVVATSSLELGIDMGLVDLVIQVESPPSVASGLQRVGRAGHQVGEVSQGVLFPKHRADLVHTAITVERMLSGQIEALHIPANPLDILAQQTVAATALGPVDVEEWFDVVRRSAPFATLPRSAFDATLDLLSGKYPSDEFAELRPRIVWDRTEGTIEGRPGAQRLAVTSGGTIPDRGLFGVYIVGTEAEGTTAAQAARGGRRVGELDEEMVYESRVGDVFALGATSWKIEDITHDRVLVSPAFGQPGKLPFWKGDGVGRPVELGRALGAFQREVSGADRERALERIEAAGLDPFAAGNLLQYLDEQKQATEVVPSDRTLVVERFQDELGDWRVVLHSPFGMPVHAPWALAVGQRLSQRYGIDGSAMAADDGIVLRVPMMEDEPPGAELFVFEPDELEGIVTDEVGGSALFAARFRECAARALLLPRQNPAKRQPLWQQRQRASQLLDVAKKFPQFPIILEAVRECLQDVYDLPALKDVARAVQRRELRLVETTTQQPSPFARSLLFGYVAQFLYEGDSPLAERRAAALSLDSTLLNELLGRAELSELLDARIIEQTERELQRLADDRKLSGLEGAADLLRLLGPLSAAEVAERLRSSDDGGDHLAVTTAQLEELVASRRALVVSIASSERYAAIEDASRLRDALGVPLPIGVPLAFIEPVVDPLGDLVGRYGRTHGPFTAGEAAARLGLGVAVVHSTLKRLAANGRVIQGTFRPASGDAPALGAGSPGEWCDAEVLRRIRRRSLAALRADVEPVDQPAFARFLAAWQHVSPAEGPGEKRAARNGLRGHDGVLTVVDQLAGVPIPASAWEALVLRSRVTDYAPAILDELMANGEVLWTGAGSLPGNDGWISLHLAETAALTLAPDQEFSPDAAQQRVLAFLAGGGGYFFRQVAEAAGGMDTVLTEAEAVTSLWDLAWAGRVTGDTFAPVRAMLDAGHTAHRQAARTPRTRSYSARSYRAPHALRGGRLASMGGMGHLGAVAGHGFDAPSAAAPPMVGGRWSAVPRVDLDPTIKAHALAELLMDRYGVLTRGSVMAEEVPGGFGLLYKVLSRLEEAGKCRRGYFVDRLGAAQFAVPATVDRLRSFAKDDADPTPEAGTPGGSAAPRAGLALAATDPANPYGAALAWPEVSGAATGHRPGRKAGALVVTVDGALILYVERGGKTLLAFADDPGLLEPAAAALVGVVRSGAVDKLVMEKVNGRDLLDTPLAHALTAAGAYSTPRGIRIRA